MQGAWGPSGVQRKALFLLGHGPPQTSDQISEGVLTCITLPLTDTPVDCITGCVFIIRDVSMRIIGVLVCTFRLKNVA